MLLAMILLLLIRPLALVPAMPLAMILPLLTWPLVLLLAPELMVLALQRQKRRPHLIALLQASVHHSFRLALMNRATPHSPTHQQALEMLPHLQVPPSLKVGTAQHSHTSPPLLLNRRR